MTKHAVNPLWQDSDVNGFCENWFLDIELSARRMGASAMAPQIVGAGINHLLAETAHLAWGQATASQAGTMAYPDDANSILLYHRMVAEDYHREATDWTMHVISMPPNRDLNWADWTNTHLNMKGYGDGGTEYRTYETNATAGNHWAEVRYETVTLDRGMTSNSLVHHNLNIFGGYRPVDIILMAEPALVLDDAKNHGWVDTSLAKSGGMVLADSNGGASPGIAEQCRARFHELRKRALPPVATWAAQRTSVAGVSTWDTTSSSPGGKTGMVVSAAADGVDTYVNLLDHAFTGRNADSPGIYAHAYRSGIGPEDTKKGTNVGHVVRVLASTDNADTHAFVWAATNWSNTRVAVSDSSLTWYEIPDVTCNSAWDPWAATEQAQRTNKIDIGGSCNSGALRVFSLAVWPVIP